MLLKKIKLHPFAGFENFEISLLRGLNIFEGPNEAGKSTIARALQFALFSPPQLSKKEKAGAASFYPKAGGDTIRITIEFEVKQNNYVLKRCWGGTEFTTLSGTDIGEITEAKNAVEKLTELLRLNQASWTKILFSQQGSLPLTITELPQNNEAKNSLSDILRGSLTNAAGVSIENLKGHLTVKIKEYFSNWDDVTNRPERGRELENKWKVNVGKILEAYYKMKETDKAFTEREKYEKSIDELVRKMSEKKGKMDDLQNYIGENTKIADDVRTRALYESKRLQLEQALESQSEQTGTWNTQNANLPLLTKQLEELERDIEALTKEHDNAKKKEAAGKLQAKLLNANSMSTEINAIEKEIATKMVIEESEVAQFEALEKSTATILVKLESKKLTFKLTAKEDVDALIRKGIEEKKNETLKKGNSISEIANGSIEVETEKFILTVSSGTEDVESLINKLKSQQENISQLKRKYNVDSLSVLRSGMQKGKDLNSELKQKRLILTTMLDGENIDLLRSHLQNLEALPAVRDLSAIIEEGKKKREQQSELKYHVKSFRENIQKLEKKYNSLEDLNRQQLNTGVSIKEIKNKLETLQPLPAGFTNASQFIAEFSKKTQELQVLKENFIEDQLNMKELERDDNLSTTEAIREAITTSTRNFSLLQKEGVANKRILEKLLALLQSGETNAFKPFEEKLCSYFSMLTQNKYKKVELSEIVPTLIRNEKIALPLPLLSKGTLDALSLAQKLSMADYYLKDTEGFLVLDDPLTDLDPNRKKSAADVLKVFAKSKQVLLFTCDPEHAKMFGSPTIQLN